METRIQSLLVDQVLLLAAAAMSMLRENREPMELDCSWRRRAAEMAAELFLAGALLAPRQPGLGRRRGPILARVVQVRKQLVL